MFYLITSSALSPSVPNMSFIGTTKVGGKNVYRINVTSMGDATREASGIDDHRVTRACPELAEVSSTPPIPLALSAYHFGIR